MTACAPDWKAFGLTDPGAFGITDPCALGICAPCGVAAAFGVSQACVHEHVARSRVCYGHAAEMLSYGEPEEWGCGPCAALGHHCPAPLVITELAAEGSRA